MKLFHEYMQGAMKASIAKGEPLIDEALSMVIDDAFLFQMRHPDHTPVVAYQAGQHRVSNPTTYTETWDVIDSQLLRYF